MSKFCIIISLENWKELPRQLDIKIRLFLKVHHFLNNALTLLQSFFSVFRIITSIKMIMYTPLLAKVWGT